MQVQNLICAINNMPREASRVDPSELPAVPVIRQLTIDDLSDFSSSAQPEFRGSDSSDGDLLLAAVDRSLRQVRENMAPLDAKSSSNSSDSSDSSDSDGEQPASGSKRNTAEHVQLP